MAEVKVKGQSMYRPFYALAALIIGVGLVTPTHAQRWQPPSEAERCPSRWGADDERGAANLMTPDVVLRAARLIRAGEVIEMGFPLHHDMPFYGDRIYNQQIKQSRSGLGYNNRTSNEEIVTTELGQIGTQIDGFGHQSIGNSLYNCVPMDEVISRTEFSRLGMENSGGMFTRGVLLDVAGLYGVDMLGDSYEITAEDLRNTLERQNLTLSVGDAVIINTGYGRLWGVDNARYYRSQPGIGVEAAEFLLRRGQPEPGRRSVVTCSPDTARCERHLYDRKPEARRAARTRNLRVCVHRRAAQAARRNRVCHRADRGALKLRIEAKGHEARILNRTRHCESDGQSDSLCHVCTLSACSAAARRSPRQQL